jgi:Asp-tRNA(Asn)/Glu-tRNA(Gln) amidotransferase A subunit family amidase
MKKEEQLDWLKEPNSGKHGGARTGAGRKSKYDETKVMRVPARYSEAIKKLIAHLDEIEETELQHPKVESTPVFYRTMRDKRREVTFIAGKIMDM